LATLTLLRRRKGVPRAVGFTATDVRGLLVQAGPMPVFALVFFMPVYLHAAASSGPGQSFEQTSGFFGKGFGDGGLLVTVSFITLILAE